MEWLTELAQNKEIPILSAFALGLLTSISPCPLATNITAISYLSNNLRSKNAVLLSGLLYTLGRALTYSIIGMVLYWGASKFQIAKFFQSKGELYLAPLLIIVGLMMLGVINFKWLYKGNLFDRLSNKINKQSYLGSLLMGILFAMAFCPYSGALYFGILIPMSISNISGLMLPVIFAVGTGIPVIIFSFLIAFGISKIGTTFKSLTKLETVMRYVAGSVFIIVGIYYALVFTQII